MTRQNAEGFGQTQNLRPTNHGGHVEGPIMYVVETSQHGYSPLHLSDPDSRLTRRSILQPLPHFLHNFNVPRQHGSSVLECVECFPELFRRRDGVSHGGSQATARQSGSSAVSGKAEV